MFRQYWIPALVATELADNDCPPVQVKLLSERLIAFRDSEGRYGLMDECRQFAERQGVKEGDRVFVEHYVPACSAAGAAW